MHVFVKRGWN